MRFSIFSTFILPMIFFSSLTMAAPDSFIYEGILEDTNGPITTPSTLTLRIYDPGLTCLLYEEQQSVTPGTDGSFSIRVGSAVADTKRTANDPQLSLSNIFLSAGSIRATSSTNCTSGYTAVSSDSRRLQISVNSTALSPEIELSSAPFAITAGMAEKVGAYSASKLLRSDGATTVPALDDTKVALLMSLLNGSLGSSPTGSGEVVSKGYVDSATANLLSTSSAFSGDVSGVASSLSVNKIKGISVDTTGIAVNKILKYDGTKWAIADDQTGSGGVTSVSASTPLSVTGTTTPSISITQASTTTSGYLSSTDWNTFNGKVSSVSVSAPLAVSGTTTPALSLASGSIVDTVLKWSGSAWTESRIDILAIKGATGIQQFPTNCTVSQTLTWNSPTDSFICADIKLQNTATVSSADQTIFVNASGSDSVCNGSTAASSTSAPNCAFQTLQKAIDSAPDFIRHKITIEVVSNLTAVGADKAIAVVNKNIAAQNITDGPFLVIKGSTGSEVLDGSGFTNTMGISVATNSRGVYIKQLNLQNFSDSAVRVDGGLAVVENVSFMNNFRGVNVSSSGRATLSGNINISLSNSAGVDGSRGIEVYQASLSSDAALNIDLGFAANNRGMSVQNGDISIEDDSTVNQNGGSSYQTAVEVGIGGSLSIASTKVLRFYMNNNPNTAALSVRGGKLSVSGSIEMSAVGNQGLLCESNATCEFYGILQIISGNSMMSYVQVRGSSTLNAQGDFYVSAPLSATNGYAIQVIEGSTFKFSPTTPGRSFVVNGGGANVTALKVSDNSQFKVETAANYNLNFSGNTALLEVTNMSSATFAANANGSFAGFAMRQDETSKVITPNGYGFSNPTRLCPGGMQPIGGGAGGFCIDTSDMASSDFYGSNNNCSSRGLKICSKRHYAMYCGAGNNSVASGSYWTDEMHSMNCSISSLNVNTAETVSNTHPYRCCL